MNFKPFLSCTFNFLSILDIFLYKWVAFFVGNDPACYGYFGEGGGSYFLAFRFLFCVQVSLISRCLTGELFSFSFSSTFFPFQYSSSNFNFSTCNFSDGRLSYWLSSAMHFSSNDCFLVFIRNTHTLFAWDSVKYM